MAEYRADKDAAQRVINFFEKLLRHSKGQWAGKPFRLLDWQREEIIKPLFGTLREDGTRRYRRGYIEIPKKNGKSTLAAGLALYMLMADGEQGAEVYSAASDREQAGIVFREAENMAKSSKALRSRLKIIPSKNRIAFPDTNSFYRSLSKESSTAEGLNIHGLIFDELHVQKDRRFWDTLIYGGAARVQPLQIAITTAGEYDPEAIGWEQHCYAEAVLKGDIEDDAFFAYIRCADPADDWQSEETWRKANPSYGITISKESMEEGAREAANEPRKLNSFLRYRLNIWTAAEERWLDPAKWSACAGEVDLQALRGVACYGGLDLSSKIDYCAWALCFPQSDKFLFTVKLFIPESSMRERIRTDKTNDLYRWVKEGFVHAIPGDVVDYNYIKRVIRQDADLYDLREVAVDPWNAQDVMTWLDNQGITVMEMRQGMASLSGPSKDFEKFITAGEIVHENNPCLNWMASNLTVKIDDNENIRPIKSNRNARIDGPLAMIMALARAVVNQDSVFYYSDPFGGLKNGE